MAGIYIHIPFCKRICYYCDFYKSRNLTWQKDFLKALKKEIILRKDYLAKEKIMTVYFGGGTPSVISPEEIRSIMSFLYGNFSFAQNPEVTFECNPEDLTREYLNNLKIAGITRLSIGSQSFFNHHLKLMNRRHNAEKAKDSVIMAHEAGFKNISVDLIYGFPGMTMGEWEKNLDIALSLRIKHLSAYMLTIEKRTVFDKWVREGRISLPQDQIVISQYEMLIKKMKNAGLIHYEISNFGKKNYFSRHNLLYWKQKKYLGLGPSAHSYNLVSRRWNNSNIEEYIDGAEKGFIPFEEEVLDSKMCFDEYLLTNMRTMWGADIHWLKDHFPKDMVDLFVHATKKWIASGHILEQKGHFIFNDKGLLMSDRILSECMIV